jgi:hypothetical protein
MRCETIVCVSYYDQVKRKPGYRKGDTFICKNKHCISFKIKRHSDINAAFNIGQRSLNTATDTPSVLT